MRSQLTPFAFTLAVLLVLTTAASAGDLDSVCKKMLSCVDFMSQADCKEMLDGVDAAYADCLAKSSCDALIDGSAFMTCEAQLPGELVEDDYGVDETYEDYEEAPGDGFDPEPSKATEAPAQTPDSLEAWSDRVCDHLLVDCKMTGAHDDCVRDWKKYMEGNGDAVGFSKCFAASSCESIVGAEGADACREYVQTLSMQQQQHHNTTMTIINNMAPAGVEVKDENGNTLYTY